METLPVGWTVRTCAQEGDEAGLLKGEVPDTQTNTPVHDLFHEDAQVGDAVKNPLLSKTNTVSRRVVVGLKLQTVCV